MYHQLFYTSGFKEESELLNICICKKYVFAKNTFYKLQIQYIPNKKNKYKLHCDVKGTYSHRIIQGLHLILGTVFGWLSGWHVRLSRGR